MKKPARTKVLVGLVLVLGGLALGLVGAFVSGMLPWSPWGLGAPDFGLTDAPDACGPVTADLVAGTVAGLRPTSSQREIARALRCRANVQPEEDESSWANYGGGLFYLPLGVCFYTWADFIEVRERFRGEMVPPLLGKPPALVDATFGKPIRSGTGDDGQGSDYATRWGCLRTHQEGGVVNQVQLFATPDCAVARETPAGP